MASKDLKTQLEDIGYTNIKRVSKKKDASGSVIRTFNTDQGQLIVSTGEDDDDYPYGVTKVLSTPFSPKFPLGFATFCSIGDYEYYNKETFYFFGGGYGYESNSNGGDDYDKFSSFMYDVTHFTGSQEWTWECKTSNMTPKEVADYCYDNGVIFVNHAPFKQDEPLDEFTEIYKHIMDKVGKHFYYHISDEETIHVVPIEYWNNHKTMKPNYDGDNVIIEWMDYVFPGYNKLKRDMEVTGVIDDMSNVWTWTINKNLFRVIEYVDVYLSTVGMVKNDEFSKFIDPTYVSSNDNDNEEDETSVTTKIEESKNSNFYYYVNYDNDTKNTTVTVVPSEYWNTNKTLKTDYTTQDEDDFSDIMSVVSDSASNWCWSFNNDNLNTLKVIRLLNRNKCSVNQEFTEYMNKKNEYKDVNMPSNYSFKIDVDPDEDSNHLIDYPAVFVLYKNNLIDEIDPSFITHMNRYGFFEDMESAFSNVTAYNESDLKELVDYCFNDFALKGKSKITGVNLGSSLSVTYTGDIPSVEQMANAMKHANDILNKHKNVNDAMREIDAYYNPKVIKEKTLDDIMSLFEDLEDDNEYPNDSTLLYYINDNNVLTICTAKEFNCKVICGDVEHHDKWESIKTEMKRHNDIFGYANKSHIYEFSVKEELTKYVKTIMKVYGIIEDDRIQNMEFK